MLIDKLPSVVEIGGSSYFINSDFRIGILFEELMQDNTLLEQEKVYAALRLFYDKVPENIAEAIENIKWFYSVGEYTGQDEEEKKKETVHAKKSEKIYSFEHDAGYIYSAFLTQYGIDLQDIKELHWWKFKALFNSLKDDNKIIQIMSFRAVEIDSNMSDHDKKYYRKMKKIYALPDERSEAEKEADFHETLSNLI